MTIVLTRPRSVAATGGRHRLGRPGLIPVTALVQVVRRGLLRSWLRPGRHCAPVQRVSRQRRSGIPAPVAG